MTPKGTTLIGVGFVGVGLALLEELCHCGGRLLGLR